MYANKHSINSKTRKPRKSKIPSFSLLSSSQLTFPMGISLLRHTFFFILFLASSVSADDAAVMSKFLASLSTAPSGWSFTSNFCTWTNVQCDNSNSKPFVIAINLNSASVAGTLPPELNQLSQLQTLDLQKNSFTGSIPSFHNMSSLQRIFLDSNGFTSLPPDFLSGLTNLQSFSISENKSRLFRG